MGFNSGFKGLNSALLFINKNPTRCNNVSKFYYSIFIWSSTCFGRHTVHHQEPKTAQVASSFAHVEGFRTCSCWTLSGSVTLPDFHFHVSKTRGCLCSFRLLMMGGVSPVTCWVSYKYGMIKFWYIAASCWIFLYEFYFDARTLWTLSGTVCLTKSTNYTSINLPRMKNKRLPVQF